MADREGDNPDDEGARAPAPAPADATLHDVRPIAMRAAVAASAAARPGAHTKIAQLGARYEVGALLGEGGMGEVRQCRDVVLDRPVALKTVRADRSARQLEARFLREARVQAQLEHPGVVPVFEVARDDAGAAFFTMRKVDGVGLDEVLRRIRAGDRATRDGFTRHRLLTAFAQICLTVDYAHTRGVLHRDLKPANVMFGEFGEVYLIDWGVAKLTGEDSTPLSTVGPEVSTHGDSTMVGAAVGTPGYMAPEQLAGGAVDTRADVFALGAVLFEILALVPLFDDTTAAARARGQRVAWDARPTARAAGIDVPPEFDRICVRATAEVVAKRYGSARSLHEAIEAYLGGERDGDLRRRLAAEHLARAETSRRTDPDTALREVNRALALAPDERRGLELLIALLEPLPGAAARARRDIVSEGIERLRRAQPLGALLFVTPWLTVYPLMALLFGVNHPLLATAIPAAWAVAGLTILVDYRQGSQERVIYPTVAIMTAVAMTALVFGPFFLMPALAVATVGNHILVSARQVRWRTIAMSFAAVAVPTLLEWAGVFRSYTFRSDTELTLHSVFARLQPDTLSGSLLLVDLVMLVSAALFAGQFRAEIERARTAHVLFAWQLSQLLPAPNPSSLSAPGLDGSAPGTRVTPSAIDSIAAAVDRILDTEIDVRSERATAPNERTAVPESNDAWVQADPMVAGGPRYVARERLVAGGSTVVDRCHDRRVGRDVAFKRLRRELCGRGDLEMRFTAEAVLQARLDHPAVPPVYDLGRDADGPWYTTKLVRGSSLEDLFARGEVDEHVARRRLAAFSQVCLAVDFAHNRGCVHGALTPRSILLGEFGDVYVVDWKSAGAITDGMPVPESGPGERRPSYVAPEQAAARAVDPRTDVFTLGVILYEMIAGRPLFAGDARMSLALGSYDARPSALAPAATALDDVVTKATAYHPEDRHTSARELHDEIEAFLGRDRDEELRRSLARDRLARATASAELTLGGRDADAAAARPEALRDLGRALALAPDRAPALALLQRLLAAPPSPVPAEVTRETSAQSWAVAQRAAPSVVKVYAVVWLVGFPILAAIAGIREPASVLAIALAWAIAGATLHVQYGAGKDPPKRPWATITGLLAVSVTSLLFGPHVLVPSVAIAMTMGWVLGGRPEWRGTIVGLGCASIAVPAVLTRLGVLGAYQVVNGAGGPIIVLEGAIDHHPTFLYAGLLIANLAAVAIAAGYAARFRDTLEDIEAETRAKVLALSRLVS